jgi:hypothetical protein
VTPSGCHWHHDILPDLCARYNVVCPGDQCPVDFGPWGAWRAFAGQLYDLEGVGIFLRLPPHTDRKLICRYEMERFL